MHAALLIPRRASSSGVRIFSGERAGHLFIATLMIPGVCRMLSGSAVRSRLMSCFRSKQMILFGELTDGVIGAMRLVQPEGEVNAAHVSRLGSANGIPIM